MSAASSAAYAGPGGHDERRGGALALTAVAGVGGGGGRPDRGRGVGFAAEAVEEGAVAAYLGHCGGQGAGEVVEVFAGDAEWLRLGRALRRLRHGWSREARERWRTGWTPGSGPGHGCAETTMGMRVRSGRDLVRPERRGTRWSRPGWPYGGGADAPCLRHGDFGSAGGGPGRAVAVRVVRARTAKCRCGSKPRVLAATADRLVMGLPEIGAGRDCVDDLRLPVWRGGYVYCCSKGRRGS